MILKKWVNNFSDLAVFAAHNGTCDVPYRYYREQDPRYSQLASWVNGLKIQYRKGTLDAGKIAALEEIGFQWGEEGTKHVSWNAMFCALKSYRAIHGHCNVTKSQDVRLSNWVATQRAKRKGTRPDSLSDPRIQKLDSIGFQWEVRIEWDEGIKMVKAFKKTYGHCVVPMVYPKNPRLAVWAATQRKLYKAGKLTEEQLEVFETLNLSLTEKASWNDGIRRYRRFVQKHGHGKVPAGYKKDTLLGDWFQRVSRSLNRGNVSGVRLAQLRALGYPKVA